MAVSSVTRASSATSDLRDLRSLGNIHNPFEVSPSSVGPRRSVANDLVIPDCPVRLLVLRNQEPSVPQVGRLRGHHGTGQVPFGAGGLRERGTTPCMGPPLGSLRPRALIATRPVSILEAGAGELLEKRWKRQTGTATWTAAAAAAVGRRVLTPAGIPPTPPAGVPASAAWLDLGQPRCLRLLARRGSRPAATTALRQTQQTAVQLRAATI